MLWTIFNAGFWSPEVDLRVVYNSVNILARVKSGDTLKDFGNLFLFSAAQSFL